GTGTPPSRAGAPACCWRWAWSRPCSARRRPARTPRASRAKPPPIGSFETPMPEAGLGGIVEHALRPMGLMVAAFCISLLIAPRAAAGRDDQRAHPETGVARPGAGDELSPVAVPEPSRRAMQYYRSGRWLWALDVAWSLAIPALWLGTGASAAIRRL